MTATQILVVEDERQIRRFVRSASDMSARLKSGIGCSD